MTSHARTTSQEWAGAVRRRIGLGRPLPLGGPRDGLWIAARPAETELRRAARSVRGIRLRALRVGPRDPSTGRAAPPAPEAAVAPGPLRVEAAFAAVGGEPVTEAARRLREAVTEAAGELGLAVEAIDLEVTDLLLGEDARSGDDLEEDEEDLPAGPPGPSRPAGDHSAPAGGDEALAEAAVRAVHGVLDLRGMPVVPGGPPRRGLHLSREAATGRTLVRVDVAVSGARRPLEVARDVREAVTAALPEASVAVLVTAVE
ncbi:nucleopolyhedrovirus P10 family protein [Streptomyces abyssomicinicus]|uniref:nucleopolyhedrovirus P10 family protein n=1 Tax=Streptomyces abyssomicinicus TaxID=574929 RepID=UPI001250A98D|nr:nucleopolyhedrovirus P10 family protein [Streptomyces abyssomicinicus]